MTDCEENIQREPNLQNYQQDPNVSDEEELLMKIYRVNIDKINNYSKFIFYTELLTFFSFLAFLVLLCFKLSSLGNFSYLFLLIPSTITLVSALITANIVFKLKELIDKAESNLQGSEKDGESGSITMKVLINITGICLAAFSFILFFYLDGYIPKNTDWNIIFIPVYIAIICCLAFAVFIAPGFFKGELYFEIGLTFIHIVSMSAFIFLLCYKLNDKDSMKYAHMFIPYYFSIGAHLIYLIGISIIDKKEKDIIKQIANTISIALLLCAGIVIQIFLDEGKKNNYYIPVLIYIAAFLGFTIKPIIELFKENTEQDE